MKTHVAIEDGTGAWRMRGVVFLALLLFAACNMDFQTNTVRDGAARTEQEQFVDTNNCMPRPEGPYARMGFVMGNGIARGIGMVVENNDVLTLASVVAAIERRNETLTFKLLGSPNRSEVAHVVLGCDFEDPVLNGESYCEDRPAQDWALLTLASVPVSCGRTFLPIQPSRYRWAPVADVSGEEVAAESFSFIEREVDSRTIRTVTRSPCTVIHRSSGAWNITWTRQCANRDHREYGSILIESEPDSSLRVLGLVPKSSRGVVGPRFDTFRDSPHAVLDLGALPDINIPPASGAVVAVERGSNALFIRSSPTQQPWRRFAVDLPGRNPLQIAHRGTEILMLASDFDDQNCNLYATSITTVLASGQSSPDASAAPAGSLFARSICVETGLASYEQRRGSRIYPVDVAFCGADESPGSWVGLTLLDSNGTIHRYGARIADGGTTLDWEEIGTSRGARSVNCADYPHDVATMFLTAGPFRPENEIHVKFREGIVTRRTDREQGFGLVTTHGRWNAVDTWMAWSNSGFYEFAVNEGSLRFGNLPERFTTRPIQDTTFTNPDSGSSGNTIFAAALHNRLYVASSRGERDRVILMRESGVAWQRFYQ